MINSSTHSSVANYFVRRQNITALKICKKLGFLNSIPETNSVADPGSSAFLTLVSGMPKIRIRDKHPG